MGGYVGTHAPSWDLVESLLSFRFAGESDDDAEDDFTSLAEAIDEMICTRLEPV